MRAPFQILAVHYRFIKGELCFCVFRRADSNVWQFIAAVTITENLATEIMQRGKILNNPRFRISETGV